MKILFWEFSFSVRLTENTKCRIDSIKRSWQRTRIGKWLKRRDEERADLEFWAGEWPHKDAALAFGSITTAKPRMDVSQDVSLIKIVERMLQESNKCERCGHAHG